MQIKAFLKRKVALVSAVALGAASILPALMGSGTAYAAQLTSRKITLSSSAVSASSVTYATSFNVASTTTIKGIVVEICQNSPLLGLACTTTNGVSATPTSSTVSVTKNGGGAVSFAVDAVNSTSTGRLILTDSTGMTSLSSGDTIAFSFTATNPSGTSSTPGAAGSFYARVVTYSTTAGASAYVSATPGTHLDDGGIALSTANQLTVNARVQEQLMFCVGTTTIDNSTSSIATDCSTSFTGSAGNTVDLGVLDSGNVYVSGPSNPSSANNGVNGAAMVRTNAVNGAAVSFYAEAGSGTNHTRTLRVSGATCAADGIPSTTNTDQCFNSKGATQGTFTAGVENFGMTIAAVNCGSTTAYTCTFGTSNNVTQSANYIGATSSTYGTSSGFAWPESGTATTIASSSSVVDDEALVLKFAGTAAITTPTGSYGVTSTYIATATF